MSNLRQESFIVKWITIACAAGLLAACGGGGGEDSAGSSASRSSSTASSTTTLPDPADLSTALLAIADLPPGWGAPPPEDGDEDDSDSMLCDEKRSPFDDATDDVEVRFGKGGYLPQLNQVVALLPEAAATQRFAEARSLFQSCLGRSWSETDDDGVTTKYTMGEVSMPAVGDESFAVRINAEGSYGAIALDAVVFRRGPVVGALGGIGGTVAFVGTGQIESSEYSQIVEAADRKVKQYVDG